MHAVVNPDKLAHLGPVSDVARLPESRTSPEGRQPTAMRDTTRASYAVRLCYVWVMAREQGGEQAPPPAAAEGVARGSRDLFTSVPLLRGAADTSESLTTVLVALGANVLIAVAKSAAAVVTGSASLVAEAAHSWADSGNEIFLLIANRRARRPPDRAHPLGHGREAYVWSLFAALGIFVAGAAVSVTHGIPNSSIRNRPNISSSGMSYWPCPLSWRESRSCSRSGRPDPRPSRLTGI